MIHKREACTLLLRNLAQKAILTVHFHFGALCADGEHRSIAHVYYDSIRVRVLALDLDVDLSPNRNPPRIDREQLAKVED